MLIERNNAGFEFRWPEGSMLVEVYHENDTFYPDAPLEAIPVDKSFNRKTLRTIANSSSDYAVW